MQWLYVCGAVCVKIKYKKFAHLFAQHDYFQSSL